MGHSQALSVVKCCIIGMKIAIILAISVIFSSGIYATEAQAVLDNSEMVATLQFGVNNPQVYPMIGTVSVSESIFSDIVFAQYSRENDFTDIDVKGKIVLAERGGETADEWVFFTDKEIAAAKNGAVGLIIYNNFPGIFFGELTHANVGDDYTPSIPVVAMSQKDGLQIRKDLSQSHNAAIFNVSPKPELDVIPEPIPELIFEGGEFTFHHGSEVIVPVQIKITNHNHKIIPVIHTIYENKIIHTQKMLESHSGKYHTFLNIDGNYAAGEYFLQLEYDGKKSTPIPFKVMKEFDEKKSNILGKGDYTKKLFEDKKSYINLSEKHFDIDFSSIYWLEVTGEIDNKGKTGLTKIITKGPSNFKQSVILTEKGYFETSIRIDRELPTGTYEISVFFHGKQYAKDEFTIKNYNKDMLKSVTAISGTVNLEIVKSNQYNILIINGKLEGQSFPEQIGIEISQNAGVVDIAYSDVKPSGEFETSLVLYDHIKKSEWASGEYNLELVESGTLELYGISSVFEITQKGNVITNFEEGVKISIENDIGFLQMDEIIDVEKYKSKELEVFGVIDSYMTGTPITVSVVSEKGQIEEFNILAKKSGEYSTPIIIDKKWEYGKYDIYVKHKDNTENVLSFNIGTPDVSDLEKSSGGGEKVDDKEEQQVKTFEIIQDDFNTEEIINLQLSMIQELQNNRPQRLAVTLEMPNDSKESYKIIQDINGKFSLNLIIKNSWPEGNYQLSFLENGEKIIFGEFKIIKEKSEKKVFGLSEILENANPETIYEKENEMILFDNEFYSLREGNNIQLVGTVKEYSDRNLKIILYEDGKIYSQNVLTVTPKGDFSGTVRIDNSLKTGFHEIHAKYDSQIVDKSEFLLIEPIYITAEFSSEPIKISQDMFIESGNLVTVSIKDTIKNYFGNITENVELTMLHPDGKIENISLDTANGGYYSHNLSINDNWSKGVYVISTEFMGEKIGHFYLNITDFDMNWFKEYTQKWIDGEISTYQYENRINNLSEHRIFETEPIEQDSIPDWMKMNAERWIDGKISQKEYFNIIKFIKN